MNLEMNWNFVNHQTIIPQLRQYLWVSSLVRPQVSQLFLILVSSTTDTTILYLDSLPAPLSCLPGLVMISAQVSTLLAKAKWTFALKEGWLEIPVNLRFLSRLGSIKMKVGLSLNGCGLKQWRWLTYWYLGVLLHLIGLTRHKDKSLFHGLLGNDRCLMLESSGDFMFMMWQHGFCIPFLLKATNASVIWIPLSILNSAMVTSLCLPPETGLYKAVLASEEKS